MDIENAANQIGADLFGSGGEFASSEPSESPVAPSVESDSAPAGDSTVADATTVAGTEAETPKDEPTSEVPPTDSAPKRTAPQTWRGEAAALWDSLPETVQNEVLKREEDIFKGIEQYKGDAYLGKELKDILKPHMDRFQRYNIHPGNHIQQLLGFQRTLIEGTPQQKAALLQQVARDYRIPLDEFGDAPYTDPATEAMRQELESLRGQFQQLTAAQQATRLQEVTTTVEKFLTDPSKPYAAELINDMSDLIAGKVCKDLNEAYELAIWRNPQTRAKEQSRLQTEAAEKLRKEAAEHAAKAAKATAARVTPTSRAVGDTAPLGTMEDTIAQTLKEIQSRSNR